MLRKFFIALLPAVILLGMVGCSDTSTEPDRSENTISFEDEFGGYDNSSEPVAFGDAALLAAASEEQDYDDPMLANTEVDSMFVDPEAGLYRIWAVWGQLEYDSSFTTPTDWSGSLSITRGAEVVRRLIRFEEGQDYLLKRTDRKLVEWVSITTVHNDGIVIDLVIPPVRPTFDTSYVWIVDSLGDSNQVAVVDTIVPAVEPVTVSFKTGPFSRDFSLNEIASLDTVVTLDDSNSVMFHGMRFDCYPCPRGFMAGHWGLDENGIGRFRGLWFSRFGTIRGYVHGHYGVNDAGKRVFFGKWISESGKFEGLLKGTWQPHPSTNADETAMKRAGGKFWGNIYDATRQEIGKLKGRYRPADEENKGLFHARWKLNCPEAVGDGLERSEDGF